MPKGRETIEFAAFLRYSLSNKITVTWSPAEVGCPRSKFIIILPGGEDKNGGWGYVNQ